MKRDARNPNLPEYEPGGGRRSYVTSHALVTVDEVAVHPETCRAEYELRNGPQEWERSDDHSVALCVVCWLEIEIGPPDPEWLLENDQDPHFGSEHVEGVRIAAGKVAHAGCATKGERAQVDAVATCAVCGRRMDARRPFCSAAHAEAPPAQERLD